jgi:leucyl-tRNA synthetase
VVEALALLLAPFTPHMAEELWRGVLARNESVHTQAWPIFDSAAAAAEEVEVVVQVNGKVRGKVLVDVSLSQDEVAELALAAVDRYVEGKDVKKVVVVPGRLVSVVVAS